MITRTNISSNKTKKTYLWSYLQKLFIENNSVCKTIINISDLIFTHILSIDHSLLWLNFLILLEQDQLLLKYLEEIDISQHNWNKWVIYLSILITYYYHSINNEKISNLIINENNIYLFKILIYPFFYFININFLIINSNNIDEPVALLFFSKIVKNHQNYDYVINYIKNILNDDKLHSTLSFQKKYYLLKILETLPPTIDILQVFFLIF